MVSRDHILMEIKRTTRENDGIPLGRQRFMSETGIRMTDWYGKYWARWGDALRDAGYEPNEKTRPFAAEHLVEKLIGLIRETGKFPTHGEIRLKHKSDPSFPGHTAFARLGGMRSMVASVLEYCRSREGYEDVTALCGTAPVSDKSEIEIKPAGEEFGFVYLLKSGRYYKIGKSIAAGRRERELQIQLPEKAKTVHVIRTDDPAGIEKYWHGRFDSKRKNGEWFGLDGADVAAFCRRKFM